MPARTVATLLAKHWPTLRRLDLATADWDTLADAYDGLTGKYTLAPTAATTDAELAAMMKRVEMPFIPSRLEASRYSCC